MASEPSNRQHRSQWDPYVCEYLLEPAFWYLGAALFTYSITMLVCVGAHRRKTARNKPENQQNPSPAQSTKRENEKREEASPSLPPPPPPSQNRVKWRFPRRLTGWIAPYLTSKWHTAAAVAVCLVVLGAQLLESYWIAATLGRLLAKLGRGWLVSARAGHWLLVGVRTLPIVFLLLMGAVGAYGGGLVVVVQVGCLVELCWGT